MRCELNIYLPTGLYTLVDLCLVTKGLLNAVIPIELRVNDEVVLVCFIEI